MQGDPRINDVITLFERMVKDRWTSPYGEKQGYIDCRLTYYDEINTYSFYPVFTYGSLGLSMLFGVPTDKRKLIVELEVEVYDHSDVLVGRYHGIGDQEFLTGLYRDQTRRRANLQAVKKAFLHIEQSLIQDHTQLIQALKNLN